jgi:ATP-binding cassette subfamily B protein
LFLGVIYTLLGLLTAIFVQLLLDKFIPQKDYSKILYSGGFLVTILIIKSIAGYLRQRFMIVLNKNLNTNINADFLEHLFMLPKKFFDSRKIGDITARINDAIRIQNAVMQVVGISIIDILMIVGSFSLMFYFSSLLAILSLAILPIY